VLDSQQEFFIKTAIFKDLNDRWLMPVEGVLDLKLAMIRWLVKITLGASI